LDTIINYPDIPGLIMDNERVNRTTIIQKYDDILIFSPHQYNIHAGLTLQAIIPDQLSHKKLAELHHRAWVSESGQRSGI
jgi:hypothetical protein